MTDDERAAREWLREVIEEPRWPEGDPLPNVARTIIRLLDRPVLPRGEDVPDDVLCKMMQGFWDANGGYQGGLRAAIDILHAHMTAPPAPKKVERWAVVWPDGSVSTHADEVKARRDMGTISGSRVVKLVEAADD